MSDGEVTIEWVHFGEALSNDLRLFYLSNQFSDVIITTDDGCEFKSHRIILAMCSPYFRDLLNKHNGPNTIICLTSMRSEIVRKILKLIYRGSVEIPSSDMQSFIETAKHLKLQGFDKIASNIKVGEIGNGIKRGRYEIKLKRIELPSKSLKMVNGIGNSNDRLSSLSGETSMNGTEHEQSSERDPFFPSDDSDDSDEEDENRPRNSSNDDIPDKEITIVVD